METIVGRNRACVVFLLCAATAIDLPAQTFTTLVSFNGADGATPSGSPLVQGTDGNLYGTTSGGGANKNGTIFKITPGGMLTTLHSFDGTDGTSPSALIQAADGNFYGTTSAGGANKRGTVFKIPPGGTLTTLYSFTGATDGGAPGVLVQGADGNFYGTTSGLNEFGQFVGIEPTIFRITPGGTLTTLYRSDATDGSAPGALVQGADGNFYGTTSGLNVDGTIFKITPGGTLTTLYTFCRQGSIPNCPDGDGPGPIIQATDGNFYGTTFFGGIPNAGTIFKITLEGVLTTLYSFSGGADGFGPGALLQATDGNFYGITSGGAGLYLYGTIFKFPPGGPVTTLHSFDITDGSEPGALVQATDGNLYGTTQSGGTGCTSGGVCLGSGTMGTVFKLALSPSPTPVVSGVVNAASFAKAANGQGSAVAPGSLVQIYATLPGASVANATTVPFLTSLGGVSVTFNGTPASISAVIPTGAYPLINAQVPFEVLTSGASITANVIVTVNGVASAPFPVSIIPAAPGIFTTTQSGQGQAILFSLTGQIATPAKPISRGATAVLYATGLGALLPEVPDGAASPVSQAIATPTVWIGVPNGEITAQVLYAGQAPDYPGVNQINIVIPEGVATGNAVPLQIQTADGSLTTSNVTIAIQ